MAPMHPPHVGALDIYGLSHVFRPGLVEDLCSYLTKEGLLVLCSERGMRCLSTAGDVAARLESIGCSVRRFRVNVDSPEASLRYIRRAFRTFLAELTNDLSPVLVLDASILIDDDCLARLASLIDYWRASGACILAVIHPEAEHVLELLPSCRVLHARDLVVGSDEYAHFDFAGDCAESAFVGRVTHGMPLLVELLASLRPFHGGSPTHLPVWNKVLSALVADSIRPSLIGEELLLRAAMLALGRGGMAELRAIGVRATSDFMADIGRSAPLFGVDSSGRGFDVVPFDAEILGELLPAVVCGSDSIWSSASRLLAERGDYVRAGVVAKAVGGAGALRDLALAYPIELVDAGLVGLVDEAVRPHKGMGPAFDLARRALGLLDVGDWARSAQASVPRWQGLGHEGDDGAEGCQSQESAHPPESARRMLTRLQVRLLEACRGAASGGAGGVLSAGSREEGLIDMARASDSRVAQTLAAHLQVLALWLSGSALEAFRVLMLARNLREQAEGSPSVFSALLQLDFEALRCLVGDPESDAERVALVRAEKTLGQGGIPSIADSTRARCDMARAMAGGCPEFGGMGRVMARRGDAGEVAELAIMHLVTSLTDAAKGSFQQANVHAWEAFRRAGEAGMNDVASLATMAERVALDGLGEGHRAAGLVHEGLEGIAADVQALVRLHASLGRGGRDAGAAAAAEMRGVSPRVELVALASLVVRADRVRGTLLARALPSAWRARLDAEGVAGGRGERAGVLPEPSPMHALPAPGAARTRAGVGASGTSRAMRAGASDLPRTSHAGLVSPDTPRLEVCVMGGLSLALGERRITERRWRRKTSKSLMALLALTPGHLVTRFEAIEFLWPEADYDRGRENLYSTLSSLRRTIGQVPGGASYLISEMGQIWLDDALVTCDVDGFEGLARSVVGGRLRDDEVIAACLRLEVAFKGGACIPSADPHGRLQARCDELLRRYVDVLLIGAEAALRLRDVRQAVWFAESASASASSREDVVACLARALGAAEDVGRLDVRDAPGDL